MLRIKEKAKQMKQESVQKQMLVVGVIIALAVAIASGLWLTKKTVL